MTLKSTQIMERFNEIRIGPGTGAMIKQFIHMIIEK